MPTKLHQMIVGLIGRKMREKGYDIVAFDGNEYLFDGQKLNIPPPIKRHKPDIVGFKFETNEICIGEAKTSEDLFSKRTKEQLLDYSNTKGISTGKHLEIILGIPKSAEEDLIKLLKELNLFGKDFISYIWLPEELVDNG
ncbi:MAG: hypothetical protein AB1488_04635 [Nitrospirota bacterium]